MFLLSTRNFWTVFDCLTASTVKFILQKTMSFSVLFLMVLISMILVGLIFIGVNQNYIIFGRWNVSRNYFIEKYYSRSFAWMFPSWLGLFVIFAFPNSVSITAPFTRMFCLARNTLEGVSNTFFIEDFFAFPFTITFAMFPKKETNLEVLPLPCKSFVFCSPIFTILA